MGGGAEVTIRKDGRRQTTYPEPEAFNDHIVAGSAIPPAEPTRKRAEAVKGKCVHCGKHCSRHIRHADRSTRCTAAADSFCFTPSYQGESVAASTKQEAGAGITDEQLNGIKMRLELVQQLTERKVEAIKALRHVEVELDTYLTSLRAKDAR